MLFSDRITVWRVSRNTRPGDRGHTAMAEFALDLVAAGEGSLQIFQTLGHRELRWVKQGKLERDIDLRSWDD